MIDDRVWMTFAAGVYATTLLLTAFSVFVRHRKPYRSVTFGLILFGFLIQTAGLHMRGIAIGSCPIGNPFEVLQFVSWSIMVVFLVLGSVFRMSLLGTFCATLAMVLNVISHLVPAWDRPHPAGIFGGNPWIEAHASMALFSYGVFGLLAVTGIMYLLQNHSLKQKSPGPLFRLLPSLAQLDLFNLRLATVGVLVFSVSLAIGSVYWVGNWENVTVGKLITTLLLWAGYIALLVGRWAKWLRGPRFAWAAVILFVIALVILWPVDSARETADEPTSTVFQLW